jgi:hypothetical protein
MSEDTMSATTWQHPLPYGETAGGWDWRFEGEGSHHLLVTVRRSSGRGPEYEERMSVLQAAVLLRDIRDTGTDQVDALMRRRERALLAAGVDESTPVVLRGSEV